MGSTDDPDAKANSAQELECSYCGKCLENTEKKISHEKRCSSKAVKSDEQFQCGICNLSFKYLAGKLKHEKKHQLPGGFVCTICSACFTDDAKRTIHRDTVHKLYKCQICHKKLHSENDYFNHVQEKHNGNERRSYVCTDCGTQYKTQLQLKHHNDSKCGTVKTFTCKHCESKFMTANTLSAHLQIHNGEKKHLCNFCGNSFLSKGQLKVHERCHTGEKPFKCDVCGKAFSYRESLVTHSSLHTGIKPYICQGCGSRFSCIGNLIKHRRSRPNSCGLPQFNKNTKIAPRASSKGLISSKLHTDQSSAPYEKSNCIIRTVVSEMPSEPANKMTTANTFNVTNIETIDNIPPLVPISNQFQPDDQMAIAKTLYFTNSTTTAEIEVSSKIKMESLINELDKMKPENQLNQYIEPSFHANANDKENEIVSTVQIQYITTDAVATIESDPSSSNQVEAKLVEEFEAEPFQMNFINGLNENAENTAEEFGDSWQNESIDYENNSEKGTVCFVDYNAETGQTELSIKTQNKVKSYEKTELVIPEIVDNTMALTDIVEQTAAFTNNVNETVISASPPLTSTSNLRFQIFVKNRLDPICVWTNGNNEMFPKTNGSIAPEIIEETAPTVNAPDTNLCSPPPSTTIETSNRRKKKHKHKQRKHLKSLKNAKETGERLPPIDPIDVNNAEKLKPPMDTTDLNNASELLPSIAAIQLNNAEHKFECEHCPKQYTMFKVYQKHLQSTHNITVDNIPVTVNYRRRQSNSKKDELICKICKKKYLSNAVLKKHEARHGNDGTLIYKCSCCPNYFESPVKVDKHQRACHLDKIKCKTCKKIFKDPDNLNAHIRYTHSKDPIQPKKYLYVCPRCGRNFSAKLALSDHERSACGETPIYKCNRCDKSYHSAGSLKTHKTIHTGELPHLCKFCGKAFRTQGQVKVHERKHNGEKPFKCEFCEKSFAYRESLLTHVSLHTGVKRFMCQACGLRFSCISNLQSHRRTHKSTCGSIPKFTKPVGPMGVVKYSVQLSTT